MNRRPHWDLIRAGWAGKWQFPCCFGVCSSPCSQLLYSTINILYLVLIEAVILVRQIIASWPKEKCSFISLLAAICQTDGFALYPETLHIQESSCFHMSCGKMIPPHTFFFFPCLQKGVRYMDHFSFFAFPLHISGGSHYSIPRTRRRPGVRTAASIPLFIFISQEMDLPSFLLPLKRSCRASGTHLGKEFSRREAVRVYYCMPGYH